MTHPTDTANAADAGPVPQLVRFFETLSPQSLPLLHRYYATQARFKDPFNDVTGLAAVRQVFDHMFVALERPRFVVREQITQGQPQIGAVKQSTLQRSSINQSSFKRIRQRFDPAALTLLFNSFSILGQFGEFRHQFTVRQRIP